MKNVTALPSEIQKVTFQSHES